ncbi:MAG: alpha/beta fold hydrolase [Paracoccaceae bacterium]
MLALTRYDGPPKATPCLIAHGLYGSARNWGVLAKRLSVARPVICVDMRNHGQSFWSDNHGYEDQAEDLAQVIASEGAPMDVIGHSMGGKAAMVLALKTPNLVRRLLVADIAPVTYSHSQLAFIHAMRAVDLSRVSRRSDASDQLAEQGVAPELQSFFTQSLDIKNGRWFYNLDALEAEMPKIMSFPDLDAQFDKSTLFLAGGASDYVQLQYRNVIRSLFPKARFAKLSGAGHWLHAEKPREFQATAEVFLS